MLKRYFHLDELGTNVHTEFVGGVTTFVTMVYIVIVNPKILEAAGIPFGPSLVATIITAAFGTLLMGFYAKRPFAIAPYMGENAFVAFTVVKVLGYSWQTALGAIFIGGVLFTLLTVFRIRSWLADAIPDGLKIGFAVGIGLFLSFVGLRATGIVQTDAVTGVRVGDFGSTPVLLALFGFLLIGFLMLKRVKASILLGIGVVALIAYLAGEAQLPAQPISMPPSLGPIFAQFDLVGALTWGFFAVVLTMFVIDLVDTTGSLLGLALKADMLDERGNLPEIEKPMLCDALATIVAAICGTTTAGVYLESATGIQAGARSGLSAVVTGLLFLLALFFAPLFQTIPACAYGPAVIIVGMLMLTPITKARLDDLTETIPIFTIVALMSFTSNLGIGLTAGFVVYPLMKLLAGRANEIRPGLWVFAGLSLLFFIFYPY